MSSGKITRDKARETRVEKSPSAPGERVTHRSQSPAVARIMGLQSEIGNRAVDRLLRSGVLQAKMTVSHPYDPCEQEAELVAAQVLRSEKEPLVARAGEGGGTGSAVSADAESAIRTLSGGGQPLPGPTRDFFAPRFGHDFGDVRIHTDAGAAQTARAVEARAFTMGRDIVFGAGEYAPGSDEGKRLLAHELTHVVQQGGARRMVRRTPDEKAGKGVGKEPKLLTDFAARFSDAADLIRKSAAAVKLVNEAETAGVKFGGYAEEGPGKRAWPYTLGDTVYVPKARTDKVVAMSDFLFELNNAVRAPRFKEIDKEAAKGAKGKLTAKDYAYKVVEQEVEGMLRLGEIWFETKKKLAKGSEWDKYDSDFFLSEYTAFKEGKKTKDDIVKDVLKRVRNHEPHKGWTVEQYYMDAFKSLSGGK